MTSYQLFKYVVTVTIGLGIIALDQYSGFFQLGECVVIIICLYRVKITFVLEHIHGQGDQGGFPPHRQIVFSFPVVTDNVIPYFFFKCFSG